MFKWFRWAAHPIDPGPEPAGPSNDEDAVKWYRKAAEKGTSWGQFNLGVCYARGQGVPQDYGEALKWFLKAAEQGEAMSQYSLGQLYEDGLGVAADQVEAYKWFHLAVGHGIEKAAKACEILRQSLTSDHRATGTGSGIRTIPGVPVLRRPNLPSIQVQTEDPRLVRDLTRNVNSAAGDDRRGVALSYPIGFPQKKRSLCRPRCQEPCFITNAIAAGSPKLWPSRFRRSDQTKNIWILPSAQPSRSCDNAGADKHQRADYTRPTLRKRLCHRRHLDHG
jgi:hypothetical protein